jgi:hypothetical protein
LDDPEARIRAHAGNALTNFFERSESKDGAEIFGEYANTIIGKGLALLQSDRLIVKESVLSMLAAAALPLGSTYSAEQVQAIVTRICEVYTTYFSASTADSKYYQLRGQCFETVSILAFYANI